MARSWKALHPAEKVIVGFSLTIMWAATLLLLLVAMMSSTFWEGLFGIGAFLFISSIGGPLTAELFLGETHGT